MRIFYSKAHRQVLRFDQMMKYIRDSGSVDDQCFMLEENHTYLLLLDTKTPGAHLNDESRIDFIKAFCDGKWEHNGNGKSKCYDVTVIVAGGPAKIKIILNDLEQELPVVIVYNSGRMASLLGMLLENIPQGADHV